MDKVEQFRKLVAVHDVTYNYSDDISMWRRGCAQKDEILALAKELPSEVVAQIWNERMDEYFIGDEAPRWYWKAESTN